MASLNDASPWHQRGSPKALTPFRGGPRVRYKVSVVVGKVGRDYYGLSLKP